MNPMQENYESSLQVVRKQFEQAKELNKEARLEWYMEVKKILQNEMDSADFAIYNEDEF